MTLSLSEWVSENITQKSILGTSYCEYIYNWNFHLAIYTLSIIFCKPSYPGWRCLWGSSLPFLRRRPSQSESSALPAEWLLLTGTGLPRRWWKIWWCSNVTCDFSETCLQSEKPCFVFDWLLSFNINVLILSSYLWIEKNDTSCNNIWTWKVSASGSRRGE